jgi:hypothetical protein
MNAASTVSNLRFYGPWGTGEHIKSFSIKLYNAAGTPIGTENNSLPINYSSLSSVNLSQKYNNVTKVEFTVVDDHSTSNSNPKRTSILELVLRDYDCTNFPNQIDTGISKYLCRNVAITPITLATKNATGATASGLPTGLTGSWSAGVFTITGTPTIAGTFTYTVTATGNNCAAATATGTLTVGASAPTVSTQKKPNICPSVTVDLNSVVTSATPAGATLVWFTNSTATGTAVTDPTNVSTAGNYYAFYANADKTCFSTPGPVVTVTIKNCCDVIPAPTWEDKN